MCITLIIHEKICQHPKRPMEKIMTMETYLLKKRGCNVPFDGTNARIFPVVFLKCGMDHDFFSSCLSLNENGVPFEHPVHIALWLHACAWGARDALKHVRRSHYKVGKTTLMRFVRVSCTARISRLMNTKLLLFYLVKIHKIENRRKPLNRLLSQRLSAGKLSSALKLTLVQQARGEGKKTRIRKDITTRARYRVGIASLLLHERYL